MISNIDRKFGMILTCKYYVYGSGCVNAWKYQVKDLFRNEVKVATWQIWCSVWFWKVKCLIRDEGQDLLFTTVVKLSDKLE